MTIEEINKRITENNARLEAIGEDVKDLERQLTHAQKMRLLRLQRESQLNTGLIIALLIAIAYIIAKH